MSSPGPDNPNVAWKEGRALLRRFIRENLSITSPGLDYSTRMTEEDKLQGKWPGWLVKMLDSPKKSNGDEYKLFCFLVRNGATGAQAAKLLTWWMDTGLNTYDPSGVSHANQMAKDWDSGDPNRMHAYTMPRVWDLLKGYPDKFQGTKMDFKLHMQAPVASVGYSVTVTVAPPTADERAAEEARQEAAFALYTEQEEARREIRRRQEAGDYPQRLRRFTAVGIRQKVERDMDLRALRMGRGGAAMSAEDQAAERRQGQKRSADALLDDDEQEHNEAPWKTWRSRTAETRTFDEMVADMMDEEERARKKAKKN